MRSPVSAAPPPARSSPRSGWTWVVSPPPAIWPPGPASPRVSSSPQARPRARTPPGTATPTLPGCSGRPPQPPAGPTPSWASATGASPAAAAPSEPSWRSAAPSWSLSGTYSPTPTPASTTWAPASTTPASTQSAPSATISASSKRSATRSPFNPPPNPAPQTLPGPGSAALRRVLPPTHSPSIFGSAGCRFGSCQGHQHPSSQVRLHTPALDRAAEHPRPSGRAPCRALHSAQTLKYFQSTTWRCASGSERRVPPRSERRLPRPSSVRSWTRRAGLLTPPGPPACLPDRVPLSGGQQPDIRTERGNPYPKQDGCCNHGEVTADAPPLPSGFVTFVFTDIEGSTRLLRRLGDGYVEVLDRHHE